MGQKNPFAKQVVLVVEDDPLLRMSAVDMVEHAGFDAIEASGADEALEILARRSDVGVLFTDVEMPGSMDGVELAHHACRSATPISIMLTSGNHMLKSDMLPSRSVFFPKPYDYERVTQTLKRLLS